MESYLMMLYVTLEQETALKSFFVDQGWTFCKPDLSVTTDELGPARINASTLDRESGSITCINGKRKAGTVPESAPKVKLVKVLTGSTAAKNESESWWRKGNEKQIKDISVISNQDTEVDQFDNNTAIDPSENEENENVIVKVEKSFGHSQEEDIQDYENEDVGDEDNDDTDIDDSMEVIEETSGEIVNEFGLKLETKGNNDAEGTGHRMKVLLREVGDGEKIDGTECSDSKEDIVEQLLSQSLQENTHKCCICAKEIKIKYNMKRHLRTHLPGQIKCIMCNQFFNSIEEKEEHMEKRHSSRHICETCGISFKRKSDLNAHMVKHNSINEQDGSSSLFRCMHKNCGKIFFRKAIYEYHLNKHSGEKPYYCASCLKTFHSKYVKNDHEKECSLLNKHYKCEVCGSMFKHRSGLHNHIQAEHVRSEKGYICEICSSSFKFASGLIRHKKEKHQCLDASQQTENVNHSAVSLQLNPVQTKEAQSVVNAQNTNTAVIVVTEGDSEHIETVTTNLIEQVDVQTSRSVETTLTEMKGTVPNPVLEKSPEINNRRVIVVHQVSGDLPDHLEGLNS